jgi:hypothetical protein
MFDVDGVDLPNLSTDATHGYVRHYRSQHAYTFTWVRALRFVHGEHLNRHQTGRCTCAQGSNRINSFLLAVTLSAHTSSWRSGVC